MGCLRGLSACRTVALKHWHGLYVIAWMAVTRERRGRGIGSFLLRIAGSDAARRGAHRVWVAARAPLFYLNAGYEPVHSGREHELLLGPCVRCEQYRISCEPVVAVKAPVSGVACGSTTDREGR